MLTPEIKKLYEEHVKFGSGALKLSKDEIRYLLKQDQESLSLLLQAREAIAHLSVCDVPDAVDFRCDECTFARETLKLLDKIKRTIQSEVNPPICLSSFSFIDKERDQLVAALEAILPYLGKAIADDCFHNCSKPSAAESAFDNATELLKRLHY